MSAGTTPTLASLAQARARQRVVLQVLRPLAIGTVVLVSVIGSRSEPRVGVVLALLGFAAGAVGVMRARRSGARAQVPFLVLLLGSASALVWLQPHGPGVVGALVATGVAALRVRGIAAAAIFSLALGALAATGILAAGEPLSSALVSLVALAAVYVIARLAGRLRDEQEQAVVLAERQRLAREMHDILAHSLSGLVVQLEGARLLAVRMGAQHEVAEAVERAHRLAKTGLDEARGAIGMLRDEELPGPERLAELARGLGVPCRFLTTGEERPLGVQQRLAVYRVAQESLTNIRKHASAERAEMRFAYEPDGVRLTVEDFGGPAASTGSGGYGLAGMRERADLLGGTLFAGPTSSGFRIELWLPA